jgi:hypothetical protein
LMFWASLKKRPKIPINNRYAFLNIPYKLKKLPFQTGSFFFKPETRVYYELL